MNLKSFLKSFKLNESTISMVLGALVIVVVGTLVANYFKDKKGEMLPASQITNEAQLSENSHTVIKGETLWKIAEGVYGSGYNWVDIANANNITGGNIEVGQELSLPNVDPKKPTATTVSQKAAGTQQVISTDTYTVVHGDNLWNIAVRAYGDGYKWVNIASANSLANPNIIHSGNVLTLPR